MSFRGTLENNNECPEVTSTEMHLITFLNSLNETAVKKQSKLNISTKDISFRKADSDILKTNILLTVTFPTLGIVKAFKLLNSDSSNYNLQKLFYVIVPLFQLSTVIWKCRLFVNNLLFFSGNVLLMYCFHNLSIKILA